MSATERPDESSLTNEAAYWHARLRNQNLSEIDQTRFRAWLSGHPERRREFDELNALWDGLDALAQSPEVLAERREIARISAARRGGRNTSGRVVAMWAVAACALCVLGALLWFRQSVTTEHYATALGEQRALQLSDDSVVTLNTSSELRVRYSARERKVELLNGQASFDVAKDPSRPFVVTAGQGEVLALGTVFDVYKRPDKIVVTLIEGRVAIVPDVLAKAAGGSASPPSSADLTNALRTSPSGTDARAIVLNAGEQLEYGGRIARPLRTTVDVQQVAAWRARKLSFVETPLTEAIAEANRYSRVKIELRSPQLREAKISGIFEVGRNDALAEGLKAYFGLQIDRQGDGLIVLTEPPR